MAIILKNGKHLEIRSVEEGDAAELLDYLKTVGSETDYLTFGKEGVGYTLEEERKFIRSKEADDNHLFITGLIDGKIIASLGVVVGNRKRIAHCGEFGMTVRKEFWNCGVGSALVDYMLDWANRRKTIKKINLLVRSDNHRAINLYLKKGFQFEGCNRNGMQVGDQLFDFYYMGRVI